MAPVMRARIARRPKRRRKSEGRSLALSGRGDFWAWRLPDIGGPLPPVQAETTPVVRYPSCALKGNASGIEVASGLSRACALFWGRWLKLVHRLTARPAKAPDFVVIAPLTPASALI